MGLERQALDQAARFALRRVRGAEHAPLGRLQRARPAHLVRGRVRVRVGVGVGVGVRVSGQGQGWSWG